MELQDMMLQDLNEDDASSLLLGEWPNMQALTLTSIITLAARELFVYH